MSHVFYSILQHDHTYGRASAWTELFSSLDDAIEALTDELSMRTDRGLSIDIDLLRIDLLRLDVEQENIGSLFVPCADITYTVTAHAPI